MITSLFLNDAARAATAPTSRTNDAGHVGIVDPAAPEMGLSSIADFGKVKPSLPLTPRQQEIVELLCSDRSPKEIARILQISYAGVMFHLARAKAKLEVSGDAALAWQALKHGLVGPESGQ